jgi:transposase InsO family protein
MLAKKGWKWPNMREHVRRFVKECDLCQKASFRHNHVKVPKYTTGSYLPMERWNMDTIGPFPPDEFNNRYVIVIIDCFTRFITLYPTKTKDSDEAAEVVLQQMGHYGVPSQILSDNGGEYVNAIIKELLELTGTEHIATIAHSHEENSIVERHNAEVGKWLREILYDHKLPITEEDRTQWSKYLPFVQRIHNTKRIGFLGYSPAQMLYGDRIQLDRSILLNPENRPDVEKTTTSWMTEQRQTQDKILAKAKRLQEEKDLRHTDAAVPDYTVFADGSYVLQDWPDTGINLGRPSKLHLMRTGPYQVVSHTGNMYTVKNLITEQHELKGIWLLRQFIFDANRTNPKDIALKDKAQIFNAEKILNHLGTWSRKTSMKFTVKWEGYTETTIEPWKNVSNSRAMQSYLEELNLQHLVPGYVPDRTTKQAKKIRKRKIDNTTVLSIVPDNPPTRSKKNVTISEVVEAF